MPPKTLLDYSTKTAPTWCPGCGDYGIQTALKMAFAKGDCQTHETVLVAGIGCGSLIPQWVKTYGMLTLHGRALPVATGVKVANHDLNVIVNCGDGDGLGIGMGHYIHFFRRNLDVTVIIDNNGVYGLTKGQTSPTSKKGMKTSSTPHGSIEEGVNGLLLAVEMGATFVARSFAGDIPHLTETMNAAIKHKGAAVIDILQPCPTFNKYLTPQFYKDNIEKRDKPYKNKQDVMSFLSKDTKKIPIGIFYEVQKDTYTDNLPQLEKSPLVKQSLKKKARLFLEERS